MKTSECGIALIKRFEGLFLHAYVCPAGKWTIGYGHTCNVHPESAITMDDADKLLREDINKAEKCINDLVTVPLNQHQFDALVSFVFNFGGENFRSSTLLRKLNNGNYQGAANELMRWTRTDNHELPGLKIRRAAERKLFETYV